MKKKKISYSVSLNFETIKLPPVSDILVLGIKHPQGKQGVMESFRFIAPDEFDMVEIDDDFHDIVDAVLINKKILKRLPADEIISILEKNVFPYMSKGEAIKVNLKVIMDFKNIQGEIQG